MNIIIIIIAFSSIIIGNAKSQFDPPEVLVANQNCEKHNPPDIVSNFVFNPTLKQRSLFTTAITFWDDKFIKSKIKSIKFSPQFYQTLNAPKKEWEKILIAVLQNIEYLDVPTTFKDDLIYVTGPIGKELLDFILEIRFLVGPTKKRQPLFDIYVDNIQWTQNGKIDEIKTIKSVLTIVNNTNSPSKKLDLYFLFFEACKYCHVETIEKIWNDFSHTDKENIENVTRITDGRNDFYIINDFVKLTELYWIKKYLGFNDTINPNPNNRIELIQNMFQVCRELFLRTNLKKLEYFLLQLNLNQTQKDNFILNNLLQFSPEVALMPHDNFVFLMQQLSQEKRVNYFRNNRDILLNHFIDSWPWRYIYFEALETSIEDPKKMTSVDYENILKEILERINNEYNAFGNCKQGSLWMLEKFWSDYKDHFKAGLIKTCWTLSFDKIFKFRTVSIIVANWDVKLIRPLTTRVEILKGLIDWAHLFLVFEEFNLMYEISEKIMKTREQKRLFLEEIPLDDICNYLIINGDRYDDIDSLIEWKYSGVNHLKAKFKKSINWISIVENIEATGFSHSIVVDKLRLLFYWLDFSEQSTELLDGCIDKYLDNKSKPVNWDKFYKCIKSVNSYLRKFKYMIGSLAF